MTTDVTLAKDRIAGAILVGGQTVRYGGKPKGSLEAVTGRSIIGGEIRQLNLAGMDDIIIFLDAIHGEAGVRSDVDLLRSQAHLWLYSGASVRDWKRVFRLSFRPWLQGPWD